MNFYGIRPARAYRTLRRAKIKDPVRMILNAVWRLKTSKGSQAVHRERRERLARERQGVLQCDPLT